MPVSLAVCETANVVNAALRESLGVNVGVGGCVAATAANNRSGSGAGSAADEARTGDDAAGVTDNLQSQIVASAKRVLFAKIEYEEVKNYNESVLAKLKSKYIVIEPDNNNKTNGAGKITNSNGHDNNNGINQNGNRKQQQQLMDAQSNQNANTNGSSQNPNELPKPKRVLYPRENIRIGWKQSERKWQVGSGMLNVGNTCYLNSTLQALFHIPALANWLVSESSHLENCNISESCGGNGCIICAMAKTLQSTQSNQSAVRPFLIYTKLRQICKHMVVGRQEDAHEFLRFLVEAMEKAYLMRFRNYKELDQLVKETTPLNQIFGGYLRSEVRCLSCNHVSITFQHFQDLLLDIRKADTLEEAFDGYFSRERLEDMGYKCEGCKKKVSATKQFSLERAPITLCIQLKRFSMMGNKLTKQISFKPRIDLSRFAARSPSAAAQPLSYRLVSMVTHLGASQHCGHYTAIGLTEAGSYYNFDDSYVRPIAMQSVCNTNAYIMFYELDVNSQMVSNGPKLNGLRLTNGQHSPAAVAATSTAAATATTAAVASPRFIGPQLPNGYANSNGHALGGVKTTIQYKSTPLKQQQQSQQQPLQNGILKLQETAKTAATATATSTSTTANKSSCNINNSTTNQQQKHNQQQRILPMSSDEEDDEDDEEDSGDDDNVKTNNKAPQLPSMPKMFEESSGESVAQPTAKLKPKTPMKSLVPYESASEEEEVAAAATQQQQPQQAAATTTTATITNPRKRRSGADSSESDEEETRTPPTPTIVSLRNGHAKTNGSSPSTNNNTNNKAKSASNASSANVNNSNKQKTDAIDEIFKSLNNYKNKHRNKADSNDDEDEDDDDDEDGQQKKLKSNGWQSQNGNSSSNISSKAPPSPKTPPSPAVIKSKTGVWKVTHNDDADDDDDDDDDVDVDNDDVEDVVPKPSKNHKNPFASNKAAEANASPGPKRQKLLNGSAKSQQTPRIGNGYQSESMANGNAVSELLKQTHRGYGSSVLSWNGKASEMDKELQAEAREQRKRDEDDDEENEMDRGRQRKIKSASVKCNNNSTPGYNPFQEYEGQKRWHGGNKSGGSFPPRFHHQNYRPNFQQRSKFKYNRFGSGSKFQQQRALQRHLASGGGFTRRQQHQSSGQQQQNQQS
ncbi:ubiquitin carboxyl-terminal hydrolase 36 [Drosophila nasuta]|uniref:ubiquitin carboxyl-terminal hydrolase 36 n=1 Tax=Drosophila nasuta TaxID=42062 RepID=UPI00295E27DA|nr:ubiquitin carboxyl-terminal hydrolase 36 [Drosophila nasuta]